MSADLRFNFDAVPAWRNGTKQILHGSEYTTVENANIFTDGVPPQQIEFDLEVKRPIIFDLMSRLIVCGTFEVKLAAENSQWTTCTEAEYSDVIVCPNWWELLITNLYVSHGNYVVKTHEEPMNVASHLNQCLYWQMDTALKKLLCVEECHPGNGIPTTKGGWGFVAGGEWHNYAKSIFTGRPIKFHWTPLFCFPFYQGSNFVYDEIPPRVVPSNYVGKLSLRISFKDDFSSIFRKRTGVTKSYRFNLSKVDVAVEEARMNLAEEKRLFSMSKKVLNYTGVTKMCRSENVQHGVFVHNCKFNSIPLPENVFIFALPASVSGGTYKYSGVTENGPHFVPHRITAVTIHYGGLEFANAMEPNLGTVSSDFSDIKALWDHVKLGPFGLFTNPSIVTRGNVANGFAKTDFPHVCMSLVSSGRRSRYIPLGNDGSVINKNHDLSITIKFNHEAAPKDTVYLFYLGYTDVNMTLDLKTKRFESPYLFM